MTKVRFDLPAAGRFALRSWISRTLRAHLEDASLVAAPRLRWDGRDDEGRAMASGLYFVDSSAGETLSRKILMAK